MKYPQEFDKLVEMLNTCGSCLHFVIGSKCIPIGTYNGKCTVNPPSHGHDDGPDISSDRFVCRHYTLNETWLLCAIKQVYNVTNNIKTLSSIYNIKNECGLVCRYVHNENGWFVIEYNELCELPEEEVPNAIIELHMKDMKQPAEQ
jgi:hypothetical protein